MFKARPPLSLMLALLFVLASAALATGVALGQAYPPPVGSVTVTASTTVAATGDTVDLTATVRDDDGNPIADQDVVFTIASQPGTDASLSSETAKTDENGIARVVLSAGSTPGNIVIEITAGDKTSQLTVEVGAAPPAVPPTGGPPPPEDGGGLGSWLIALVAGAGLLGAGGVALLVARRRTRA